MKKLNEDYIEGLREGREVAGPTKHKQEINTINKQNKGDIIMIISIITVLYSCYCFLCYK